MDVLHNLNYIGAFIYRIKYADLSKYTVWYMLLYYYYIMLQFIK